MLDLWLKCNRNTFLKAYGETLKIQSELLIFNSQKVIFLFKCRICEEAPYVGKEKMKFRVRFKSYKSVHMSYRKNVKYNTVIMGLTIGSSN